MQLTTPRGNARLGGLHGRLFLLAQNRPRSIVYIDGFNLYYGAVKGTPHKWLDLQRFFTLLRPDDDIQVIRYFTALITGPGLARQQTFLQALATRPLIEVILGSFKTRRIKCRCSGCAATGAARFFDMPEEKRTDVNVAIYMLDDAYQGKCDCMIVVSGDSDLVPAVRMVRSRFPGIKITVYVPARVPQRGYAVELRTAAHAHRLLPLNLLPIAQFPTTIPDGTGGFITKPASW